jgi:NAD(P)-dependent dehydrogenase (short-subunit alcohol dehydrogenase family)
MTTPTTNTQLKGKVALITGAGRGIGAGIARELGARGASVVVNYRGSAEAAEALANEITAAGSSAIAIQADISNVDEIKVLFQKAKDHFKKIDIVVSNSGIEHFGALSEVKPEDFDRVFNINTRGQFFVGQQAYEHLSDGGRLILMSSISAHNAIREHAVYAGSKCAVEAFARCFSQEFGARRITVNSIAPGGVKTDMAADVGYKYLPMADASWTWEQIEQVVSKRTPMGRIADPVDIARVVAFLASDDGGWMSGRKSRKSCLKTTRLTISCRSEHYNFWRSIWLNSGRRG